MSRRRDGAGAIRPELGDGGLLDGAGDAVFCAELFGEIEVERIRGTRERWRAMRAELRAAVHREACDFRPLRKQRRRERRLGGLPQTGRVAGREGDGVAPAVGRTGNEDGVCDPFAPLHSGVFLGAVRDFFQRLRVRGIEPVLLRRKQTHQRQPRRRRSRSLDRRRASGPPRDEVAFMRGNDSIYRIEHRRMNNRKRASSHRRRSLVGANRGEREIVPVGHDVCMGADAEGRAEYGVCKRESGAVESFHRKLRDHLAFYRVGDKKTLPENLGCSAAGAWSVEKSASF